MWPGHRNAKIEVSKMPGKFSNVPQRAFGLIAAAALIYAMYWSVRLAYADELSRGSTPDQIAGALRLAPLNAEYWLRWADSVEATGKHVHDAFQRAAALDASNASIWIRAGLQAEAAGDFERAEELLLRASRLSRQYQPRWTLANYYFRRGDAGHFWPWAKSALEWSYSYRGALFDLCWGFTQSPDLILSQGIPAIRPVQRDYLMYLLAQKRLDAAETVSRIIEDGAIPIDRVPLLYYVNVMLDAHRWDSALTAWNVLCGRKILACNVLDPRRGISLTNGAFQSEVLRMGFDWRSPPTSGVTTVQQGSPAALRITFSGKQPEQCEVLQQLLPLLAGTGYRLYFEYQTSGIKPETGLQWKAFDGWSGVEVPVVSPHLASQQWTSAAASFTVPIVPPNPRVLLLALTYVRMQGTTRIEGEVRLRNVRLEVAR
jgi:tetratricopeptide (TPR) repeat protein